MSSLTLFSSHLAAIIFTILGVLAILAYFPMRKRIPFSRLILLFVLKIAKVHKSVYGIALATSLLQAMYSIWWGFTIVGVYQSQSYFSPLPP